MSRILGEVFSIPVSVGGCASIPGSAPTRHWLAGGPLPGTNHPVTEVYMKKAIITGITGQDGSHLADLLLEKDYEVHGVVRRSSTENFERIAHLKDKVQLHQADLLDQLSIIDVLE